MKTFWKIVGFAVLTVALIKGIQLLVDRLYNTYAQNYVVSDISDED